MPCPHYSRENNDCALLQEAPQDDEESTPAPPEDHMLRDWCVVSEQAYRNCPVYRRYLAELLP